MLASIEHLLRQLSWVPGLEWLDTWVNSMYSQAGQYDQIKGDMELRAQEIGNVATDPLGTKTYGKGGAEDGEAIEKGAAKGDKGGESAGTKGKEKKGAQKGRTAELTTTKSDIPPQYRARRSATRASCMMFIFLVILVAVVWTIFWLDPKNVPWRHAMSWWRIALQVVLVIAIPIVLHRIIRAWLEGAQARYPDLQYAWDYGLQACELAGVPIDQVPLYLILGSANDHHEVAINSAANLEYRAAGLPRGPAALHWYVTNQAIYLYATDVGWTSSLAQPPQSDEEHRNAELPGMSMTEGGPVSDGITAVSAPDSAGDGVDTEGTIMHDQWEAESGFRIPEATPSDTEAGGGEKVFEQTLTAATPEVSASADSTTSQNQAEDLPQIRTLSSASAAAELARLKHLGRLIRNVRSPLSPLNGVVTMVPHHLVDSGSESVDELHKAISSDLAVIENSTQIRTPATVLITGMEHEKGFCELIRRVGPNRALAQRFGKRYDVSTERTEVELKAFNVHLVGAFEDWIYTLFREKDALMRPGNTGLYELLGKVRCHWKPRLEKLLARVFAPTNHQPLFSGCYFAATGDTKDRQAFVRAIFDKLNEEQELLEWTRAATREDKWIRRFAVLGYLVALGGLAAIVYRMGSAWQLW